MATDAKSFEVYTDVPGDGKVEMLAPTPMAAAEKRVLNLARGGAVSSGTVVVVTVMHRGVYRVRAIKRDWEVEIVASGEERESSADHDCG